MKAKEQAKENIKAIAAVLKEQGNELAKGLVPEVVSRVVNCNIWGGKPHTEKVQSLGSCTGKSGKHLMRKFTEVMDERLLIAAARKAGVWIDLREKNHFQRSMHHYYGAEVAEKAKAEFLVVQIEPDEEDFDEFEDELEELD